MKRNKKKKKVSLFKIIFSLPFKILLVIYTPIYLIVEFIYKLIFTKNVEGMGGIEFEYYVADLLRNNRYKNVSVTALSNDYGIDVFATKHHIKYAIQCKRYYKKVGVEAVQQAASGCIYHNYDIAIVLTNSTYSPQAKNLAECLGVQLWDGKKLQSLQSKARFYKLKYIIILIIIIVTTLIIRRF